MEGGIMSANGESFGDKLKRLREAAGLSLNALADQCGLTRQALGYLEQGERAPSWDTVQRLALALGVTCQDFIDASLALPDVPPKKPTGRPRKDTTPSPEPVADPVDTLPAAQKK